MTEQSPLLTRKQKANLDYAYRWLRRAQKDFNVFKRIVKFDKNTLISCADPALAVYLLQQSIEKAIKAVVVTTGKYSYSRLIKQGHNSLAILLDFYNDILKELSNIEGSQNIANGFGVDLSDGTIKIDKLINEAKKKSKERVDNEVLYREQFAQISPENLEIMLDMLLGFRENAFIGTLRSFFSPHGKFAIEKKELNTKTPRELIESILEQVNKKTNLPKLPEAQKEALISMAEMMAPNGIDDIEIPDKFILERRNMETQSLGQWALLALYILASFTFPHESTSRYPGPRNNKHLNPNGCEDYSEKLGIVNQLGKLGYITTLLLSDLKTELAVIASFKLPNIKKV